MVTTIYIFTFAFVSLQNNKYSFIFEIIQQNKISSWLLYIKGDTF